MNDENFEYYKNDYDFSSYKKKLNTTYWKDEITLKSTGTYHIVMDNTETGKARPPSYFSDEKRDSIVKYCLKDNIINSYNPENPDDNSISGDSPDSENTPGFGFIVLLISIMITFFIKHRSKNNMKTTEIDDNYYGGKT